jgi:CAAX prenyl protease-like protein
MSSEAESLRLRQPAQWARAQVLPFAVFMGFLLLLQYGGEIIRQDWEGQPWWRRWPEHLVYPVQTIVGLAMLARFRAFYEFHWQWRWILTGVAFGAVGIGFWLLPTTLYDHWGMTGDAEGWRKWLGLAKRDKGFNPWELPHAWASWLALVMRFLRAAVLVALVEEIFWRSFLSRYIMEMDGKYAKRAFGEHHWKIFLVITGLFILVHAPVDYAGALVYGSMTYLLCVWSKNLGACVVMHGTANLLMGLYAMAYGKYGLW